ncbi:MAG: phosphatase PAP2 family protein [Clostridia bacterium]|nr:phosphatase PAP2 family protein [Clostridia bacterium]
MEKYKKKIKNIVIKNLKWIIVFVSLVSFCMIVEDVIDEDIMSTDSKGYAFIVDHLMSDRVTPVAKIITNFGGVYWLIGFTIFLLVFIKNKRIGVSIAFNLVLAALINFALKCILQRPRPVEYRIIDEKGYSLPSGHSMVSVAFYGYIIYLVYKYVENKYAKWSIITLLCLLTALIGISRVYLGVHYTSDVLAGGLIAFAYLITYINFIKEAI